MKTNERRRQMKLSFKDFKQPIIFLVITVIFCALFLTVDIGAIGPNGTTVGFKTINGAFAGQFGFNELLYKVSDYLGYLSILGVGAFACLGLYQLIKGKGLKGVDKGILLLGALFVVIFAMYIGFDKLALNYRPVIPNDETTLEASFPSSHTLMAATVMGSIIMVLPKYIKNEKLLKVLKIVCIFIFAGTVVCRLFSGAHWVTDIVASLLISMTLLSFFKTLYVPLVSE